MKKGLILLFVVIFFVSIAFVGTSCKATIVETTAVNESTTAVETTAAETAAVEKPTLTLWASPTKAEAFDNLFQRFQEDTGYKLDIITIPVPFEETLLTKWASGERPDIVEFHIAKNWFSQLNPEENLIDLSDMEFASKTKFGILDVAFGGGKVYGTAINPPAMFGWLYNKEIFEANSLKIPQNFDEFLATCEKLKSLGITPLYAAGQDLWPLQLDALNFTLDGVKNDPNWWSDINSGKTTFEQPAMKNGLEADQKLIDDGFFQDNFLVGTYEGLLKAIFDGEVAMVSCGDWFIPQLVSVNGEEEVNKKIGAFGLSLDSNCVGFSINTVGGTYALPKTGNTEKEAGAKEFIKYITGGGYQKFVDEMKQLSSIEGFNDPIITVEPYNELKGYFDKDSCAIWQANCIVAYGDNATFMQEMYAGTKTPDDVLKALTEEFSKNAKTAGIEGF